MIHLHTRDHRIIAATGAARKALTAASKEHRLPEATLRAEWRAVEALKEAEERALEQRLRRVLARQAEAIRQGIARVQGKHWRLVAAHLRAQKADVTPLIVQTLIDWAAWDDEIADAAGPALQQILEAGFEAGLSRIALEDAEDLTSDSAFARSTIDEIVRTTKEMNATTRQDIAQTIQRGLVEGRTQDEIAGLVGEKTEELTGYRLRRAVRTASNGGFEAGQLESWRKSGITHRTWLSQRDPRVRTPQEGDDWSHRTVDGQRVTVEEPFLLDGAGGRSEALLYPSDPAGSPGNIVNCRCGQLPRMNPEAP